MVYLLYLTVAFSDNLKIQLLNIKPLIEVQTKVAPCRGI